MWLSPILYGGVKWLILAPGTTCFLHVDGRCQELMDLLLPREDAGSESQSVNGDIIKVAP